MSSEGVAEVLLRVTLPLERFSSLLSLLLGVLVVRGTLAGKVVSSSLDSPVVVISFLFRLRPFNAGEVSVTGDTSFFLLCLLPDLGGVSSSSVPLEDTDDLAILAAFPKSGLPGALPRRVGSFGVPSDESNKSELEPSFSFFSLVNVSSTSPSSADTKLATLVLSSSFESSS